MYYVICRELGNGYYDYIDDIEDMILTDNPASAQQFSDDELGMIDMEYMNEYGFYAMSIERFDLGHIVERLFRPPLPRFRPRRMADRRPNPLIPRQPMPLVPGNPPPRQGNRPPEPRRGMSPHDMGRPPRSNGARKPFGGGRPMSGGSHAGGRRNPDRSGGRGR